MMYSLIAFAAALAMPLPRPAPTPAATPAPQAGERAPAVTESKPTSYCVMGAITGSRMARKTCLTRQQWLDRGFDPLAPDD